MNDRLILQTVLENIMQSRNVYYQPPNNFKMNYPAIKYSLNMLGSKNANNEKYFRTKEYVLTIMDKNPDSNIPMKLLKLPYTTFDRQYVVDGLYHTIITLKNNINMEE